MRCFTLSAAIQAAAILAVAAGTAFAASEGKFSKATVDGITKSLTAEGCEMGEIVSGNGSYTVSKAKCADGTYDVTVDTDFKVTDKKKKE
jgi:cytochrome c556